MIPDFNHGANLISLSVIFIYRRLSLHSRSLVLPSSSSSSGPCLFPFCQPLWLIEWGEAGIGGQAHTQRTIDWSGITMEDMKNEADRASIVSMALYTVMFPVFNQVKNAEFQLM